MLLRDRWFDLWARLKADGDGVGEFADILIRYTDGKRKYHNTTHLEECFEEYDIVAHTALNPEALELGIWYHDLIYITDQKGSEAESADFAAKAMRKANVPLEIVALMRMHILATADHTKPTEHPDTNLMLDIDLSIIGKPLWRFDAYEAAIREEYMWVPESTFREGRVNILQGFLRGPIYRTPYFLKKYEASAQANLERSIARLTTP